MVVITEKQRDEVIEHLSKLMFYLDKKSQEAVSLGICALNGILTVQIININDLMLALEFGYKQHELGNNIQSTKMNFIKIIEANKNARK